GKEPSQEVHRGNGHAYAKEHTGEDALGSPLTKCEGKSRDHDRDQGQATGNGAGERLLQNIDGVFPRRICLRQGRRRECGSQKENPCGAQVAAALAKQDGEFPHKNLAVANVRNSGRFTPFASVRSVAAESASTYG